MKSYVGDIPNTYIRDFQRQRVYNAEESCGFWENPIILSSLKIKNLVEAISLWAGIDAPKLLFPAFKNGRYIAYATSTEIVLPFPTAKSLPFVCHEMAHVINYNSTNADHHGKYFVRVYLNIVNEFIGQVAFKDLRKSLRQNRVKYARA